MRFIFCGVCDELAGFIGGGIAVEEYGGGLYYGDGEFVGVGVGHLGGVPVGFYPIISRVMYGTILKTMKRILNKPMNE